MRRVNSLSEELRLGGRTCLLMLVASRRIADHSNNKGVQHTDHIGLTSLRYSMKSLS